ncbi:MAG TPA: cellulase family glycosylhydrolase [Devosia sp.]|nr:cellulase family glycosylhydrolase [Devosia sp.]
MKRLAVVAVACLALISAAVAAPIELKRGVGVHDWLNWAPLNDDGTYRWPPYRDESEWLAGARPLSDWPEGDQFTRIRAMGFDFVRLSVDPGPLVASIGDRRQEALAVLETAVRKVSASGLKVVFDLHGVSQVPQYSMDMIYEGADSAGVASYRDMVADVARMLVAVGVEDVAIEPYNEPAYYPCDASGTEDWQQIMADTVADIRAVSIDLTVVVTGACGGSITGLTDLDPAFDDPNLLYNFHMYEPHSFTHQRHDDPESFASGLPWPASGGSAQLAIETLRAHMDAAGIDAGRQARNIIELRGAVEQYFAEDWGQAQLEARIAEAVAWAERHDIAPGRLFMGEFGAILMTPDGRMGAFNQDRLRYLAAVRQEAEKYGFPWSIWEYSNPYGMTVIVPAGPAVPDTDLLEALGLAGAQ